MEPHTARFVVFFDVAAFLTPGIKLTVDTEEQLKWSTLAARVIGWKEAKAEFLRLRYRKRLSQQSLNDERNIQQTQQMMFTETHFARIHIVLSLIIYFFIWKF